MEIKNAKKYLENYLKYYEHSISSIHMQNENED